MDVAEFFVVRAERRKGIGAAVAHALFELFPGPWEIRVRRANAPALRFWSRVVGAVGHGPVAKTRVTLEEIEWDVLRFNSTTIAHPQ